MVVAEIVRGLYEGRFVPGQKLLENDLTQRFGVGRGSVREALRCLEAEGMVTAVLNRGAAIRVFSRSGVRDLLEVMEQMAGVAARLAAERICQPEDAAPLRKCVEAFEAGVETGSFYPLAVARYEFYGKLVALAKNRELFRLLVRNEMTVVQTQFRSAFDLAHERQDLADYKRVVDRISAGDGAGAERAIRQLFKRAATSLQRLPDSHFAG